MGLKIGQKVKSLRTVKNISQNALAKKAGIAQSTLSYIERGKKHPQFDTLSAICNALDTSMLDLLSFQVQRSDKNLFEEHPKLLQTLTAKENISANNQNFEKYLYNKFKQAVK